MSVHRSKYAAVVVGAGPAGICAVGNMLERRVGPILWVDDAFNGGRVNSQYREVPSNTKTKLFIDFAEALTPFQDILEKTPSPNAISHLRDLPQDKGTTLGNAADMLLMLTNGLIKTPGVEIRKGRVEAASLDAHKGWTVSLTHSGGDSPMQESSRVVSDRLILCTGSSPASQSLPVDVPGLQELDLDFTLAPSRLKEILPRDKPVTVAVIGASHSAILVLLNLSKLALSTHPNIKIKWFTRHSLRYAVFMDGWILRDNTGLKGEAAEWAKNNLEPERFADSPVSRCITPISYEKSKEAQTYEEHLPGCNYVVQAIGYNRDPLPDLKGDAGTMRVDYDPLTGAFSETSKGEKIPGLYGAGIAFPERVTDPHGNVEYSVGFWKFMRYMKRVTCDWN
ncbi:hypothetical protein K461DRAFT_219097 [Myriangium duriaei CBS 260.36]|uniref:FAD/NAD(P)-binding domain-containing protein n=1 Tax=Myriangium duriaei CBS 260.36 TaxID=1168546 RepID=A0A9P4JD48_9PEZI|nr:hypothetical protein K461DRAFT_219097 [Myriangium duriaei CBS 260.36]